VVNRDAYPRCDSGGDGKGDETNERLTNNSL
jgi:hypothetical protein